jgi:hypothetical protein
MIKYIKRLLKRNYVKVRVPRDLYDKLDVMAKNISTQDNRGTRLPIWYQICEDDKECGVESGYEDGCEWVSVDGEATFDQNDQPEEFPDPDDSYIGDTFTHEGYEYTLRGYRNVKKFTGAWLTEEAIEAHIKSNHYHYNNGRSYVQYAWRNSDLYTVAELFELFHVPIKK